MPWSNGTRQNAPPAYAFLRKSLMPRRLVRELVALTRRRVEFAELTGFIFPILGVRRGFGVDGNVRPYLGVIGFQLQPLLNARLGVGLDRIHRAFGFAHAAI